MKFKGLGKESAKMLWKKIKAELFNKSVTDVKLREMGQHRRRPRRIRLTE